MPGHRDNREHGGNGVDMAGLERGDRELLPKRAGPGIRDQGSGRGLQHLDQGHRPGRREQSQHSQEAGPEAGGFC